ncbi:MAG: DUF4369 domain-containing protein [Flavobacteriaceae bacterium]|nr:DUF4369 domain-containing protein [Flavobacteriaceae bacterium]
MKKTIFLLALIISIISCKKENEMNIEATITGLKKGTVYLQKIQDSSLINLDSIVINGNDTFTLSTIVDAPELFYIYVDKVDGIEYNDRVTFFGEKGELKLNTHLNKINSKVIITGSKNHRIYTEYQNSLKNINTKLGVANIEFIQAQLKNDQEAIVRLDKKISKLMRSKYLRAIQFALNHKRTSVAAFIGAREIPEANVKYLDTIYNGLSKKAKNTVYGIELATLIKARK